MEGFRLKGFWPEKLCSNPDTGGRMIFGGMRVVPQGFILLIPLRRPQNPDMKPETQYSGP